MSKFYQMTPMEAAEKIVSDPESVLFPLALFMTQFGFSSSELHAELIAGRIVAFGRQTECGYEDITISAKALFDWLSNEHTPINLRERVLAEIKSERPK